MPHERPIPAGDRTAPARPPWNCSRRTLATELRERGVAAVIVDPGDMRTRMHQEAFPGEDISDRPLPEVTAPFWHWLLDQKPADISGERFAAQQEDARWLQQV